MRILVLTCALLAFASNAAAQMTPQRWLEFRPNAGALVPTGDQGDLFDASASFGLQLAYELKPNIHFVGSFGWTPTDFKLAEVDPNSHILSYDVGAEFNLIRALNDDWDLKPFLGAGAGGRTYAYDEDDVTGGSCTAGYATLGTEFQRGSTALRLEARDYLYCYKHPISEEELTRNDVAISLGVAYHVGHRN